VQASRAPEPRPASEIAPLPRAAAVPAPVVETSGNGRPAQVVVPVKLQKGGTYEIVIRLEVEDD
jgi:hypothetical protein